MYMQEQNSVSQLKDLIDHGTSPFHVVSKSIDRLRQEGFVALDLRESWREIFLPSF